MMTSGSDSQNTGRRALRAADPDENADEAPVPRRGILEPDTPAVARRAAPAADTETEEHGGGRSLPRGWWAIPVAAVAVLAIVLWALLRPNNSTTPATSHSPAGYATPSVTSVSSGPTSTAPQESALPQVSAPPLPGAPEEPPAASVPAEPAPTGSATVGEIQLNDTTFTSPPGWILYGDDMVDGDRRAVRLSDSATDIRLQAVTLEPGSADLGETCQSLVTSQQAQFTEVSRQLVVPIGAGAVSGSAVNCGFSGVRTDDATPNIVTFTLVSRASDSHILLLRHTVPTGMTSSAPAMAQLNAMSCEASSGFGVALPLC